MFTTRAVINHHEDYIQVFETMQFELGGDDSLTIESQLFFSECSNFVTCSFGQRILCYIYIDTSKGHPYNNSYWPIDRSQAKIVMST